MVGVVHPVSGQLRRRDVLVGAGRAALGVGFLGWATSACSSPPPPDVDDLRAQLTLAADDSELARAAVPGAPRSVVPALTQIASERSRHAQALADEISRTLGTLEPATPTGTSPTSTAPTGTSAPTTPAPPPSVADVVAALRTAADSAARYAVRETGYRAGLLGSIAASCTAAYTVALPTPGSAQ